MSESPAGHTGASFIGERAEAAHVNTKAALDAAAHSQPAVADMLAARANPYNSHYQAG